MSTNGALNRKLRMGLVGGGQGAFIGRVHCTAAVLDNRAALVAGALSSDPQKAKASAPDYDIPAERAYGSYREMIAAELKLPEAQRIDFVTVATPNHTHFEIAKAALEAGFNVVCDKPLTLNLDQAEQLATVVDKSGAVFAADAQLHRLSAGAAGPADGPLGRTGRDQRRARLLHARLAPHALGAGKPETGLLAHRSGQERRGRLLRRYRHARLQSGAVHDRSQAGGRGLHAARCSKAAASSTTMARR